MPISLRKTVKDNETVIEYLTLDPPHVPALNDSREFNELDNMSAGELEDWLKEEQSAASGWEKGDGSGETAGHER